MPYIPRTAAEILQSLAARAVARSGLTDLTEGSVLLHVLASMAEELASTEIQLEQIRDSFFFDGLAGALLDERAGELPPDGLSRLPATASGGTLQITRKTTTGSLVLPVGSLFRRSDDPGQSYRTTADVTFGNTVATITASAVAMDSGTAGNCQAGKITVIESAPDDIITVTNTQAFTSGLPEETDAQLQHRMAAYLGSLARCQPKALEYAALTYVDTNNQRAKYASLYEDPLRPGYSELVVDDGEGGAGSTRNGSTSTGTVSTAGILFMWHEWPATVAIDQIVVTRGASTLRFYAEDGFYTSIPERGIVYLADSMIAALQAGDVWNISTLRSGAQYQIFTGIPATLQAHVEGNVSDPTGAPGLRAAGTRVRVRPAEPQTVTMDVHVLPTSGVSLSDVSSGIKDNIVSFLASLAPGESLYIAQLIDRLMNDTRLISVRFYVAGSTVLLLDQVPSNITNRCAQRRAKSRLYLRRRNNMGWWNEKLQDIVRFQAQERLDLVDADALQEIVYNYVGEALGALIGKGGGCVSAPVLTYTNNGTTWWADIGPCQIYYSFDARRSAGTPLKDAGSNLDPGGSDYGDGKQKAWKGMFLTHDPSDAGQASHIDITAIIAAAHSKWAFVALPGVGDFTDWFDDVFPFLWARPVMQDVDPDARREWNIGSQAELPITPNTRTRTRVEWKFQFADPNTQISNDASGIPLELPWVKVGRILQYGVHTGYDSANRYGPDVPILYPISLWDSDDAFSFTQEPGGSTYAGTLAAVSTTPPSFVVTTGDTGKESYYGMAPVPGNTAGMSVFLSPKPKPGSSTGTGGSWRLADVDTDAGFEQSSSGYISSLSTPPDLSLINHLHLIRDRIKAHLTGDNSSGSADSYPWYSLPGWGLPKLKTEVESNTTSIGTVSTSLATVSSDASATNTALNTLQASLIRPLFRVHVAFNASTANSYVLKNSSIFGFSDLYPIDPTVGVFTAPEPTFANDASSNVYFSWEITLPSTCTPLYATVEEGITDHSTVAVQRTRGSAYKYTSGNSYAASGYTVGTHSDWTVRLGRGGLDDDWGAFKIADGLIKHSTTANKYHLIAQSFSVQAGPAWGIHGTFIWTVYGKKSS